jgi:hypothetical protein
LGDDTHAMGRFLREGLKEYLQREGRDGPIPDHQDRLRSFRAALSSAVRTAEPLVRIVEPVMQQVHPGQSLDTTRSVQQFPFPPGHPARGIVEDLVYCGQPASDRWSADVGDDGVESVLLMSRLTSPVHPAAVASLYQPIVSRWNEVIHQGTNLSTVASIDGFWIYNRARPLTEAIPLPDPAVVNMVRGWFTGRLLGLITAPTEQKPFTIVGIDEFGAPRVDAFPWPLLRHGQQPRLHKEANRLEWLPALLEHIGLAMMALNQDPHALDAYERLFHLGKNSAEQLAEWISTGETIAGCGHPTQVTGADPSERRKSVLHALTVLREMYATREEGSASKLVANFETFRTLPYGYELTPLILECLSELEGDIANRTSDGGFG